MRCRTARDVRGTVFHTWTIARPVIDTRAIDDARTMDESVAVATHRSLEWSLDRVRHYGVVVHGRAISRPLDRSLHHIGHDGVIAILIGTVGLKWIFHEALRCT